MLNETYLYFSNTVHYILFLHIFLATVSRLKKKLNDLELRETEEINQLELERSLLNAEFDSETQKISKAKMKIALLRHKETRLSGFYEELQKEFRKKLNEAQSRISTIQEALERSPENNVQLLHEQLEIERKKFEDMEFNQMEEVKMIYGIWFIGFISKLNIYFQI